MPRLPTGRGRNPHRTFRLDQLQLNWVEAYAITHSLSFLAVIHVAITYFLASEFTKMNNPQAHPHVKIGARLNRQMERALYTA